MEETICAPSNVIYHSIPLSEQIRADNNSLSQKYVQIIACSIKQNIRHDTGNTPKFMPTPITHLCFALLWHRYDIDISKKPISKVPIWYRYRYIDIDDISPIFSIYWPTSIAASMLNILRVISFSCWFLLRRCDFMFFIADYLTEYAVIVRHYIRSRRFNWLKFNWLLCELTCFVELTDHSSWSLTYFLTPRCA